MWTLLATLLPSSCFCLCSCFLFPLGNFLSNILNFKIIFKLFFKERKICVLPPFSRTDTLPSPSSPKAKGILSHPGKRPAVTHVSTFKSACKMMSQWVFVAWPIFAKKNNCILLQENIVLSHGHCCVALETGLVFYSRKRNCLWIPCPHAGRVDCSQISFQNSSGNFTPIVLYVALFE